MRHRITRADLKAMTEAYHDKHAVCLAGCQAGWIAPDPDDIDSYTLRARTVPCKTCKGAGFVPRQYDLFPETLP
ncbi:hypothetical protein KABACHOK_04790 [Brevundimonas phage vB_BpoS-Kabachok]|uniref:Uncharacterized protein n=1 Tax=Brevundimonas phage vB_BpoS-Kabachok TaxID=2948600 RepID=A0A9E7SLZ2_9CAUD|nr:hypothetical protein KABACHOK_04790 [Brevundimonas phage vB_BpoS-Kabachok]